MDTDTFFKKNDLRLVLGVGKFEQWSRFVEVGIANAGTATEQLVGLGVPCVSLPGKGPQFKRKFAVRQSRLLGGAVTVCRSPELLAKRTEMLLNDDLLRKNIGGVGLRRMGQQGGSAALAVLISKFLLGH